MLLVQALRGRGHLPTDSLILAQSLLSNGGIELLQISQESMRNPLLLIDIDRAL